jgi:hypothetical protein
MAVVPIFGGEAWRGPRSCSKVGRIDSEFGHPLLDAMPTEHRKALKIQLVLVTKRMARRLAYLF